MHKKWVVLVFLFVVFLGVLLFRGDQTPLYEEGRSLPTPVATVEAVVDQSDFSPPVWFERGVALSVECALVPWTIIIISLVAVPALVIEAPLRKNVVLFRVVSSAMVAVAGALFSHIWVWGSLKAFDFFIPAPQGVFRAGALVVSIALWGLGAYWASSEQSEHRHEAFGYIAMFVSGIFLHWILDLVQYATVVLIF